MSPLIAVHLAATLFMTGLIWFVQVVHYPLFARVGESTFAQFEAQHQRRTTWVVAPAMLTELFSGVLLVLIPQEAVPPWAAWLGLGLIVCLWASTFFIQVPLHRSIERGFDLRTIRRLSMTNWLRTALWSARSMVLLWVLVIE